MAITQTTLPFEQLAEFTRSMSNPMLFVWPLVIMVGFLVVATILVVVKRIRDSNDLGSDLRVDRTAPSSDAPRSLPEKPTSRAPSTPQTQESFSSQGPSEMSGVSTPPTPAAAEPPREISPVEEIRAVDHDNWVDRLRRGLSKTRDTLRLSLASLVAGRDHLDDETLERLHESLYRADLGVKTTDSLIVHIKETLRSAAKTDWELLRTILRDKVQTILVESQAPIKRPPTRPWVILVVGVNGVGKTTTIGKLGASFLAQGQSVTLCAADTFRAAAIDQLQVWGERIGAAVVKHQPGSDPAAVAFDAVKAAKARETDVLLIDTAGRLHSKEDLMAQLAKIKRIIAREIPDAPHETWLVLDATTGQNAVAQVKSFLEVVSITGIVITKLDGTAKGGVVVGIADQFRVPIRYIGVGEKAGDLREFDPADYASSLF